MTLISVLAGIFIALIADELISWVPKFSRFIIKFSTQQLYSDDIKDRVCEEYLADLEDVPGKVSKLLCAMDSFRGVYLINHEHHLCHVSPLTPIGIRVFDVIFSGVLLIFVAPIFLLTALLIFSSTLGAHPVFIRRMKIGLHTVSYSELTFRCQKVGEPIGDFSGFTAIGSFIYKHELISYQYL